MEKYMGGIMNQEKECDGVVYAVQVEGLVPVNTMYEVKKAFKTMREVKRAAH